MGGTSQVPKLQQVEMGSAGGEMKMKSNLGEEQWFGTR